MSTKGPGYRWIYLLLLIAAASLAYHNSFQGTFIFDDRRTIVHNPFIRRLWPPWEAVLEPPVGNFSTRAALNFTLALNYAFSGTNPWGYHWVNLIIHLLAGLVLFGILRRTINVGAPLVGARLPQGRAQGPPLQTFRNDGLAFSIALLWLVHPLQTQSVTYIIQRAESLMGLFYLLTLYSLIRGSESKKPMVWYAISFLSCLLGMFTKEVMMTAPLIALLYDRTFLTGSFRRSLKERKWLYASFLLCWVVFGMVVYQTYPRSPDATAGFSMKAITPLEYLLTQSGVILHYLRLAFWPHPLILDYHWPIAKNFQEVTGPFLVILILFALTLWALVKRPKLGFWGAWFFLILAPTSSFIPIEDAAFEHRMYLPLAAVITLIGITASTVIARTAAKGGRTKAGAPAPALNRNPLTVPSKDGTKQSTSMQIASSQFSVGQQKIGTRNDVRVILGFCLLLLIATTFTSLTLLRNRDYRTEISIWEDTARKNPTNPRPFGNLGYYYFLQEGNAEKALEYFSKAIERDPEGYGFHNNLGNVLRGLKRYDEALHHYEEALRLNPDSPELYNNLANVYRDKKDYDQAIAYYEKALKGIPDSAQLYNNLAIAYAEKGEVERAIQYYKHAIGLRPGFAEPYNNLALVLAKHGQVAEAVQLFEHALQLDPNNADVRHNLNVSREHLKAVDEQKA